jgi:HAD superfamily phosphoserine phosphatase-like hydrolase
MKHVEQGIDRKVYYDAAKTVVERTGKKTYMYTRRLLERLRQEGYLTIVLSMSTGALIKPLAEMYRIDIAVCNEEMYDEITGVFKGLSIRERGISKGHLLQEIVQEYSLDTAQSYAVGDTASDASILEMVGHPIAFNPDRTLQQIAISNGWKIVVERKNALYELEYTDGTYLLNIPDA